MSFFPLQAHELSLLTPCHAAASQPTPQVVRLLKTNYRMLITGTPLQVGAGAL